MIDVWEEPFLDTLVLKVINPIIDEANALGMKIIYAPSKLKQNSNLKIVEDGVVFFHLDVMDKYIDHHKIQNLFYIGFDALYCVIDKPNGIFAFKNRYTNRRMNLFVLEPGITSYTKEMKETAISLFKKYNIGVVYSDHFPYEIPFPKQTIKDLYEKTSSEIKEDNNFVLIFKNDLSGEIKYEQKLERFSEELRSKNILYAIVENNKMYFNNKILEYNFEFIQLLDRLKIDNIFYCGYHLNREILWSNFGITSLYIKKRYYSIDFMPEIYIINDLSYIVESQSIDPVIEKSVLINHYRSVKNIMLDTLFE